MQVKFCVFWLITLLCQFAARAQWQFVKGDTYNPQLPKYGLLNQPHPYSTPGGRAGAATWTYNDKLYLFGGSTSTDIYSTNVYNDIWQYDPASKMWTWIKGKNYANDTGSTGPVGIENATNLPAARARVAYWIVNNMLYVYDGDMWCYNCTSNNWSYLGGTRTPFGAMPVYGQQGVANAANNPWGRTGASYWSSGNHLYLFGGRVSTGELRNDLWRYDITTHLWTWIKGSNTATFLNAGVEGTIGVENSANTPGNKYGATTIAAGSMVYVYGGTNSIGVNYTYDLWRFNATTENWTKLNGNISFQNPVYGIQNVYSAANTPGSREQARGWFQNGSLFLFGGLNDGSVNLNFFNDLWQFDTASLQWKYIKGNILPNQPSKYNYLGVTIGDNVPGAREGMQTWELNNKIYIANGSGYSFSGSGVLADMWQYENVNNSWTWIGGTNNSSSTDVSYQNGVPDMNNRPGAGMYAARWLNNDDVYVFGRIEGASIGSLFRSSLDALWKYNINTNSWTLFRSYSADSAMAPVYGTLNIADSLNTPGTRAGEATWVMNNKLYLFGGQSHKYLTWTGDYADSLMNDLWEFDLATGKWRWIKGSNTGSQNGVYGVQGTGAAANMPGGRTNPLFWQENNKFYLMGGRGRSETGSIGVLNDLWEFDPVTGNWRWLKGSKLTNQFSTFGTMGSGAAANTPGGRYSAVCWALNGRLYTFLGRGIQPGNTFGDPQLLHELWAYDIASNNWIWLKGNNSSQSYTVDNYANYGTKGVASAVTRPPVYQGATGSVINGKLYLFGGSVSNDLAGCTNCVDGPSNNLWAYDPATNYWAWIEGSRNLPATTSFPDTPVVPPAIWPGTRNNSLYNLSWSYNNRFYIFGGENYAGNNEVWAYNLCNDPLGCNSTPPQVFLGNDTTICAGGYKELNAGNFGAGYLWSTGDTTQSIAVTQSGTYWVRATNSASLSASDTIAITFAAAPSVPFGGTLTVCPGAPDTLDALNPGATYLWSTGETTQMILADTTAVYSVVITNANGCSANASINVWQAPRPDAYLGPDTGECSLVPGYPEHAIYPAYTPGLSYLWNTGDTTDVIFVTQTDNYSLLLTNEYGCVDRDTVLISFDTPIVFSLGNDTAICPNMPLVLNAAHLDCTYSWSDNTTDSTLVVNQAGNYSVYLTTRYGCQSWDDINISVLPLPLVSDIQVQANGDTIICSVVNPQNVSGYTWHFGDNTTASGASVSHIYTQPGNYTVSLVYFNACDTNTLSQMVQIQFLGIDDLYKGWNIDIYPNPAKNYLNINAHAVIVQGITLYNALGQQVLEQKGINASWFKLDIPELSNGIYQLKLETRPGSYSCKVIISK